MKPAMMELGQHDVTLDAPIPGRRYTGVPMITSISALPRPPVRSRSILVRNRLGDVRAPYFHGRWSLQLDEVSLGESI
jgi:hypothetical protein